MSGREFVGTNVLVYAEDDCKRLLSEDMQNGRVIETLTIEDPFAALA